MTEKRFYVDNDGDLYDTKSNQLLMVDFGYAEAIYVNSVVELLNTLHEENERLKRDNEDLIIYLEQANSTDKLADDKND